MKMLSEAHSLIPLPHAPKNLYKMEQMENPQKHFFQKHGTSRSAFESINKSHWSG